MFRPLAIGTAILLFNALIYALAAVWSLQMVGRIERTRRGQPVGYVAAVSAICATLAVALTAHLVHIAIWAGCYVALGQPANFEDAFYYSADNYTALGIGDVRLHRDWRLLGPIEAANGVLMFGLTTALIVTAAARLTRGDDR